MKLVKKQVMMVVDESTGECDGLFLQNGGGRMIPYTLALASEAILTEWIGTPDASKSISKQETV